MYNDLNEGQRKIHDECINWYKNESSQVFEISGAAGTGKTYLIFEILRSLGIRPQRFLAMAYTGQASIVMRTRGFYNASSIHSSLYETVEVTLKEIDPRYGVPRKKKVFRLRDYINPDIDLFFIDEAYMVPERMVKDILSFGKRVIVSGDSNQLPPVGDNPGFLTGYGVHRLTELMRQAKNNPIVYLADRAIKGLPIHSGTYGNVMVIYDDEFIPEMIGFADVVACGTNRTREIINAHVRNLAGIHSQLPIMGERIICRKNNWNSVVDGIALTNGLAGTVLSNPDVSSFKNRQVFKVHFKPDLTNNIFTDVPINFEYFLSPYDHKQEMKSFTTYDKQRVDGEFFEYAYALTAYLMQGSEYNKGVYIQEFLRPQIQNQLDYTAITRFKHALIFVKKREKYLHIPGLSNIF